MNEVVTLKESIKKFCIVVDNENKKQDVESITLDLKMIEKPEIKNQLKKEILELAGLLK